MSVCLIAAIAVTQSMGLVALDWFILLVLAGGLIRGFFVGAVRQVASLVGFVLAFFLSVQLMHVVGEIIVATLGFSNSVGPIAGFVVVFIGIQLLFVALSRLLEKVLETLSLTLVNRAAGGALGGFKAALLLSVLFLVLAGMDVPKEETREESMLYSPVASALPKTLEATSPYLPAAERASDAFGKSIQPDLQRPPRPTQRTRTSK